jgi:hypothetical protein
VVDVGFAIGFRRRCSALFRAREKCNRQRCGLRRRRFSRERCRESGAQIDGVLRCSNDSLMRLLLCALTAAIVDRIVFCFFLLSCSQFSCHCSFASSVIIERPELLIATIL